MSNIRDLKVGYIQKGDLTDASDAVAAFEALIGQSLPADYREFVVSLGQTIVLETNAVAGDRSDPYPVDVLYGMTDHHDTLTSAYECYSERLPRGVIAIGTSASDDQICLALASAERQGIYYWNHEGEVNERMEPMPDYSNMGLMAATFSEMLAKMETVPDVPIPKVTFSNMKI